VTPTKEDQVMRKGGLRFIPVMLVTALVAAIALTVAVAKPKMFDKSEDFGLVDEPTKWLPDYDKLAEGGDADWTYFPAGSLKGKSVTVKAFTTNAPEDHAEESATAAKAGKKYLEQWLKKSGFKVVDEGAELSFEDNVFDAWEPTGAHWGGWAANPGAGLEVMAKDSSGKVVAEIRHKSRGSTIKDAVENGLEDVVKDISKVK
jgi:hypothetical protein